jgi:predicted ribosomally synthesized peptide with SipW-like signal peptide
MGIAIISILNFLLGLYLILIGLGLVGGSSVGYFSDQAHSTEEKSALFGVGIYGVFTFTLGLITLIAAVALWRLKTWAWYLAFLVILVNLVQAFYSGAKGEFTQTIIIHCVVYGLFALYFLAVKKHFGSSAS